MRESIVECFPEAQISISIVWIDMLPGDNEAAAERSAQIIRDPRVQHFHDPNRLAGAAIAKGLLKQGAGPAWDIYLFYGRGSEWTDRPPNPSDWMHQLGGGERADPARFRWGEQLIQSLYDSMKRLVGPKPA